MSSDLEIMSVAGYLQDIKDYWFLISLAISLVLTMLYMVVYEVSPWDKYREIQYKRQQVTFHNKIGYALLERGYFTEAKEEFDNAARLNASNFEAINGRYLSQLFLALESPESDPALGLAFQRHLDELGIIKRKNLLHIVVKYLGDLHYSIGHLDSCRKYYLEAIEIYPGYIDALQSSGWFLYFQRYQSEANLCDMVAAFRKITELDPYDYRGFHGLGYALYMQAIFDQDADKRATLVHEAALQSERAMNLQINRINILGDFGEVARSVNPELSIYYHELAVKKLNDPSLNKLPIINNVLSVELIMSQGGMLIDSEASRCAWITYQMALDHLAIARKNTDNSHAEIHASLYKKAAELDANEQMLPVYQDQLAILDLLLPASD